MSNLPSAVTSQRLQLVPCPTELDVVAGPPGSPGRDAIDAVAARPMQDERRTATAALGVQHIPVLVDCQPSQITVIVILEVLHDPRMPRQDQAYRRQPRRGPRRSPECYGGRRTTAVQVKLGNDEGGSSPGAPRARRPSVSYSTTFNPAAQPCVRVEGRPRSRPAMPGRSRPRAAPLWPA